MACNIYALSEYSNGRLTNENMEQIIRFLFKILTAK